VLLGPLGQSDHAARIANFAIAAIAAAAASPIDLDQPALGTVKIRAGFHSGPVVASVVGHKNPRYWCSTLEHLFTVYSLACTIPSTNFASAKGRIVKFHVSQNEDFVSICAACFAHSQIRSSASVQPFWRHCQHSKPNGVQLKRWMHPLLSSSCSSRIPAGAAFVYVLPWFCVWYLRLKWGNDLLLLADVWRVQYKFLLSQLSTASPLLAHNAGSQYSPLSAKHHHGNSISLSVKMWPCVALMCTCLLQVW